MNYRERYFNTMRFQCVDHPPLVLPGAPWTATRKRWEKEGLPAGADLYDYYGLEPAVDSHVGIDTSIYPPFEEKIIEETMEYIVKFDRRGVKVRNFKDEMSMAEHLEYPIRSIESLSWLREKLDWNTPGRIRGNWLAKARDDRAKGEMIYCNGGMYFAFLNEAMGTDKLMLTYFDCPEFVHEINELQCKLCENTLNMVLPQFKLDKIGYHEDMAYKNGSLISPEMFREFMTPYYKRIQDITNKYGIDMHVMDSDGDISELIPLWIECGINIVLPLEVAAGMDVVKLRKEYGDSLAMIGGFDKRIMAAGKEEIKAEFDRIRPVIESGGYIPTCDHAVPPDVSFENYSYMVEILKNMYGIK